MFKIGKSAAKISYFLIIYYFNERGNNIMNEIYSKDKIKQLITVINIMTFTNPINGKVQKEKFK
jgi:hypothetical protein